MRGTVPALILLVSLLGACVSKSEKPPTPHSTTDPRPLVTFNQPSNSFETTVRLVSEQVGGGLVLMSGIETRRTPPMKCRNLPYLDFVRQLAEGAGCAFADCPHYCFVYPPGYESLLDLATEETLDASYANLSVSMTFSFDTPLFEACSLVSHTLGVSIVTDNIVAEARCGSLTVPEIPLAECLNAMLQSARVPKGRFKIDSTPEYTFIYSVDNRSPRTALLGEEPPGTMLDARVDVVLGIQLKGGGHLSVAPAASRLGDTLDTLSRQLGVTVTAERGLEALPVSPYVLNGVRVRTALDLLIRQWPVPGFGYEASADGIVIKRRQPLSVESEAPEGVRETKERETNKQTLPAAAFGMSAKSGIAPLEVYFTDQSEPGASPITSWTWNFGDRCSSTRRNPTHEYTSHGTYNVLLTVTTDQGSHTAPPATIAVAAPDPEIGVVPPEEAPAPTPSIEPNTAPIEVSPAALQAQSDTAPPPGIEANTAQIAVSPAPQAQSDTGPPPGTEANTAPIAVSPAPQAQSDTAPPHGTEANTGELTVSPGTGLGMGE